MSYWEPTDGGRDSFTTRKIMRDMDDASDNDGAIAGVLDDDDSSFEVSPAQDDDDDDEYEEEARPSRRGNTPVARKPPVKVTASADTAEKATARPTSPKKSILKTPPKKEETRLPPSSSNKKRKRMIKRNIYDDADGYDIVVPNSLLDASQANTEFSLLLQINDDDQLSGVDWTSAIGGVIGRMELGTSPDEAIVLDLQGQQYHGYLFPGPTACVFSMVAKEGDDTVEDTSVLRLEHITDEFCNLVRRPKTQPAASTRDNYFHYQGDVDVNREVRSNAPAANSDSPTDHALPSSAQKRPRSQGTAARGNKRKKRSVNKK